jgi:predicted neuraminidase
VTAPADLVTDGVLRARDDDHEGLEEALLPAPTVQSHAANLTVLGDGSLGCVWFGGTQEGVSDIDVWFSRLEQGAAAWTEPVRLSDDPTRSEQNPLLFPAPDGRLWLLHTAQHAGDQDTSFVRVRTSRDHGRTWSEPRTLLETARGGVFVRQPPVVLPSGAWVLPTFTCVRVPGEKWVGDSDTSSVWVSTDEGGTWVEREVPGSTGCVHMSIVPLSDGRYAAYYRSRWADHVYRSVSDDGLAWSEPQPTELPNNNSSIQAAPLSGQRIALVLNESSRLDAVARRVSLYDEIDDHGISESPAAEPQTATPEELSAVRGAFWGAPRAPLTLAVSDDDGQTWPVRWVLEDGDGYCLSNNSRDGVNRELSYPSVCQDETGTVHVAYTYHRRAIRHVRIPAAALDARTDAPSS